MVLDQMITDEQILTATNSDVLAGTQLDQPGVPGVYTIWGASTVGDTTISVSLGGRRIVNSAIVVLRANSEIREDQDVNYQILSKTGGRPVIDVTETTAMSCRIRTSFLPAFPS